MSLCAPHAGIVKVHAFGVARRAGLLEQPVPAAPLLVFTSTRELSSQVESAFGTPWLASERLSEARLLEWVSMWRAGEKRFERRACTCCVQPFAWLSPPEGRLRLLRRYNHLLGAKLTEAQLRLVHAIMDEWSTERRRGAQQSSSVRGRERLDRAVPNWRHVLEQTSSVEGADDEAPRHGQQRSRHGGRGSHHNGGRSGHRGHGQRRSTGRGRMSRWQKAARAWRSDPLQQEQDGVSKMEMQDVELRGRADVWIDSVKRRPVQSVAVA